jgi:hypothetical protein
MMVMMRPAPSARLALSMSKRLRKADGFASRLCAVAGGRASSHTSSAGQGRPPPATSPIPVTARSTPSSATGDAFGESDQLPRRP